MECEQVRPNAKIYIAPHPTQSNDYYDLRDLREFEQGNYMIQVSEQSGDMFYYTNYCFYRWMQQLQELEKQLKAIIYDRAICDLNTFIQKRLLPIMDCMLTKLQLSQLKQRYQDESTLKIQCYCNEILLLVQRLSFKIFSQFNALSIVLLRKLFGPITINFFDSRFQDYQMIPVIQNFYAERLLNGVSSQMEGLPNPDAENIYTSRIFYPLQNEALSITRIGQNAYFFSPFQRIQIHYFYINKGLVELTRNSLNFSLQNIELLELIGYFQPYLDKNLYRQQIEPLNLALLNITFADEEMKNINQSVLNKLTIALDNLLQPFYTNIQIRDIIGRLEMQLFLQCLRGNNLEKRIFGLQQFCEKLNLQYDEYYTTKNILDFFQKCDLFNDLFGEKAHFEIIKRCFPLVRFLYENNNLNQEQIFQMFYMVKGKHETWSNVIFKILSDLCEILKQKDLEQFLNVIVDDMDMNTLGLLKQMGRNPIFDSKKKKTNLLEDLDENISNIKQDNLIIKVHEDQKEQQTYTFQVRPQQEDNISSEDEDEDHLKARIIEILLNVVHQKEYLADQAFQIACYLICNQFKTLRQQYLLYAFQKLFELEAPLPLTQYMTLTQKIIQSQYPIDHFKSQQDLIKHLDITYNFKIQILALIGKLKRKYIEFNQHFLSNLDQILKFYQYLYQASDQQIEAKELRIMWQLMAENAISPMEQDIFFNWLQQLNKNLLASDAQQLLFFEYLVKVDYNCSSAPIVNCLTSMIIYFNVQYKQLRIENDGYFLVSHDLIGLDIVWRILFESENQEICRLAFSFLQSVTKFRCVSIVQNQLKAYFIHKVFSYIDLNTSRALDFCLKLLEDLEGLKKNEKGDKIFVSVQNKCKTALPPKRIDVQIYSGMTIFQVKQLIGQRTNPTMKPEEFEILARGKWLTADKELIKEYKFDEKITFQIHQTKATSDEENAYQAIALPCAPTVNLPIIIPNLSQQEIKEKIDKLIEFSGEVDRDFLEYLLEQKNWNEETVLIDLFEGMRDHMYIEYQEKNRKDQKLIKLSPCSQAETVKQSQTTQEVCIASIVSEQYIGQLFEALNDNDPETSAKVWNILSLIPRNRQIYELIDGCCMNNRWELLFNEKNQHRLFYNLQILKEQLDCDILEDADEFKRRDDFRDRFLRFGGLESVKYLMFSTHSPQLLALLISIYQVYEHAYGLSRNQQEFQKLCKFRESVNNYYKEAEDKVGYFFRASRSQSSSSSAMTPNFQSENPTPQLTPRDKVIDEQKFLIQTFKEGLPFEIPSEILYLSEFTDRNIEQVFQVILTSLYLNPNLIGEFPLEVTNKWVQILVESEDQELRRLVACTIITISEFNDELRMYFQEQLIPELPRALTEDFYLVLSRIIDRTDQFQLVASFLNRPINELRFGDHEDKPMQGALQLLNTFIEMDHSLKERLPILEIYDHLFHLSDDYHNYPKYKRKLTRKRAFNLILEACKNCPLNFNLILPLIMKNHENVDINELEDTGIRANYVGLKNLGATCYINSLLQQLFMNIQLRQGLLEAVSQSETVRYLQDLFIQLKESVKQFINPQAFIQTLQGYDGQAINVLQQQDVNEFFNLLTDKLEQGLKDTKHQSLIHDVMGGVLAHEIRSIDPDIEFVRESDEPFLTVTLEIKGKKALPEALDMFIKGDILEGENKYFCEEIGRKLDIQKRCYFKKLPQTFVVTLKRFEFDYNTMLKQKVNDYFEFPATINMFRWTKAHLIDNAMEDESNIYNLVGVLVHTGNAEGGHYYSYIKMGNWYRFDDRNVTQVSEAHLKDEWFGGTSDSSDWYATKSKNAYLLFYEKPCQFEEFDIPSLKNKVIAQNSLYLKQQLFYSQDYLQFVKDFVNLNPITEDSTEAVQLMTLFAYETLIKNKDAQGFNMQIQNLLNIYLKVPLASYWLFEHIQNNLNWVNEILFECSYLEVKQWFVKLLTQSLQILCQIEEHYLLEEEWDGPVAVYRSKVVSFLMSYTSFLNDNKIQTRRAAEYFQVLKFAIFLSPKILYIFEENKLIANIFILYIKDFEKNQHFQPMILRNITAAYLEASYTSIVEVICTAIMGSKHSPYYLYRNYDFEVQPNRYVLDELLRDEFRKSFIIMVQLTPIIVDLANHLCWQDPYQSSQIIHQILYILLDYNMTWQTLDPLFRIIYGIMQLEDGVDRSEFLLARQPRIHSCIKGVSIIEAMISQFEGTDKNYGLNLLIHMMELTQIDKKLAERLKEHELLREAVHKFKNYRNLINIHVPTQKINRALSQVYIFIIQVVLFIGYSGREELICYK